ncbi:proline--tRNA ligase [Natranaeroarchaeum sulfidigenes]|uniref:Proline--tRNA ligase n=1 Tax=Natranaeroarchaeum sulfidigenes TaxID=2784880 RepID=A0A897MTP7_9EURY|nr:proline--tRNA ligase [Natranaeroarchaeum sulfidigenes]QSG03671.1 Prolyl-tRNA synthetase [Natranaeroarchaeum sulfidigenes]
MSEQELGITESKEYATGDWYAEVVQKAKLADYAPMGGFIVTRPRGYALWEALQDRLDGWFKETGVTNAYFPMFIPESFLEREKDIVEGFDPEVAWVTHGGHDELEERLAVRPTSESIIAPFMAEWTRSHRDLPLRLNQWCSVVRWEATETKPFFRTKEFLWQEGHTAHEDEGGAWDETMLRLDQYEQLFEDVLAIPVMRGRKPEHDKFPGAHTTTTVEALMPDGKSVQSATSHYLGTSFAEAFDLTYTDENEDEQVAHTTSWGLSWRSLGALIMTHSDDQGLVLPPTIAPTQVAIVPIWQEDTKDDVLEYAEEIADELEAAGISVELDDRDERNPGFKFNEHELNGVPVRFEIGPHEVEDEEVTIVHRPDGESIVEDREDIAETAEEHFDDVYDKLYDAAEENLEENVREAESPPEILGTIGQHGGYVECGWCGDEACETVIKDEIAAEIVMCPLDRDEEPVHDKCAICDDPAEETAYFARTY